MLRYFPFGSSFDPSMGGRALQSDEALIDIEADRYVADVALKRRLLTAAHDEYYRAMPEAALVAWEVLDLVCRDLARHQPAWFELERERDRCTCHNGLLDERTSFVFDHEQSLPLAALDWVGRQVQEDLVLVRADAVGTCVGGQLCFPNGWDIGTRIGLPFLGVHEQTPASTMQSVHVGARLLGALKPGKTFWRASWNFKLTDQLDLSTKHKSAYKADFGARAPRLTERDIGRELFIRIERQTFTRLERAAYVLFGIHTYSSRLEDEARDPNRARSILAVVRGAPDDVKQYKAIAPIEHALIPYLERASAG